MSRHPATRTAPATRSPRALRAALAGALALSISCAAVPVAGADDLTDREKQIQAQLAASGADVDDYSKAFNDAAVALAASQQELTAAQATLAAAQQARAAAQAKDAAAAKALATATAQLDAASKAVTANQAELDRWMKLAGASVRMASQQDTDLLGLASLVSAGLQDGGTTADVNQRLQWSTTIFSTTQARLDKLSALQIKLDAAKQARTSAAQQVTAQKAAAAQAVKDAAAAEKAASDASAAVAAKVAANQAAQAESARQLAAEQALQAKLLAESRSVDAQIKARILAQQAAAASANIGNSSAATSAGGGSIGGTATQWFNFPVTGPITSPYGMRMHPVKHVWKLHDGTDFGAPCDAPITAPRDGVVAQIYFSAGYGNRLMLDHGMINGHYITTGYNHATDYVVKVGQHVTKGQLIGHVGTTGSSTGCHLHLMVWQDGAVVNPMTTWF